MNYWLNLFTGETWEEFRKDGATVSGFSPRAQNKVNGIAPGDILLCYLTGVMRWVGALEFIGPSIVRRTIWKSNDFPVRVDVKSLVLLEPENGVLMSELCGKVDFYNTKEQHGKFKGFVRSSPNKFKAPEDGALILQLLREANANPVERPVDPKKLAYKPFFRVERKTGRQTKQTIVSVPEREEPACPSPEAAPTVDVASTRHTEIQYMLLKIGADMGLNVWVARNDRSKQWGQNQLGTMPGMIQELPTQFNEVTNRTIELIDVLWLKGNSIVAAFEIECTTSIYSGLLRMSDLLALQPNLNISLYLVAPDDRREKVKTEIIRPTFQYRDRPLGAICGFLCFSTLIEKITGVEQLGLARSISPDFLRPHAEYFGNEHDTSKSPLERRFNG